jgi:hypothetical protein
MGHHSRPAFRIFDRRISAVLDIIRLIVDYMRMDARQQACGKVCASYHICVDAVIRSFLPNIMGT